MFLTYKATPFLDHIRPVVVVHDVDHDLCHRCMSESVILDRTMNRLAHAPQNMPANQPRVELVVNIRDDDLRRRP